MSCSALRRLLSKLFREALSASTGRKTVDVKELVREMESEMHKASKKRRARAL